MFLPFRYPCCGRGGTVKNWHFISTALLCCATAISLGGVLGSTGRVDAAPAPAPAPQQSSILHFVTRNGSQLLVDGKPFHFAGFNNYYLPTYSPWTQGRTDDVDVVFQEAQSLGLKVMRTWAYSDGSSEWNAIQPEYNVLNETILSQGLDYVVATAGHYGIRLVLTLTNYLPSYGGAPKWVQWLGGSSITDFWTSPVIRQALKGYTHSIVQRNNSITGVRYCDDPTIMAWDLVNEPFNLGDDTGKILTAWVKDMSDYVKSIDPNHLVMVGSWGYFGASTPALLPENPSDTYAVTFLDIVLFPADRICHGEDFSAILGLPSIDMASMHIYPEYWSFCTSDCNLHINVQGLQMMQANLSEQGFLQLCSPACRLTFLRHWLSLHLQECTRIGKPLVVGEFGSERPMDIRNDFYRVLYEELAKAKTQGLPAAGSLLWMLTAPGHQDYDGYTVYTDAGNYGHNPQPPHPLPPAVPPCDAAPGTDFYNEKAYWECASRHIPAPFNPAVDIWNDGWQTTIDLIKMQASNMSS
ncbi:g11775 [Coccomyxa elongata]